MYTLKKPGARIDFCDTPFFSLYVDFYFCQDWRASASAMLALMPHHAINNN